MNEYPRWHADSVKDALKSRRVVIISGARQTGKTTLAKEVMDKDSIFMPLDKKSIRAAALDDPTGFVKNEKGTMVIDEIQKAPDLIPEIKYVVDNNNRPGQYLLTGSANIQSLPSVSESLAGRVKNLHLRPLTQGEILRQKPTFLKKAFDRDFPKQITGYDKDKIFDLAFRGGYPEAVSYSTQTAVKDWHNDYIDTLIKRDLKDVANIKRQNALRELIGILASWSGKFMDIPPICTSLGLSKPTVETYINALETLYLFEKVPAWTKTDYGRIGRSPKIFAADTGLMTSVLRWNKKEVMLNTDRAGKLAETFVFQELAAQVDLDAAYSLYQYRDRRDREIDFLIEREDGALIGVEVKAGHNVSKSDFTPQIWFRDNIIKGKKAYTGYVMYSGEDVLQFGEDMIAIPTASLWQ
ncbi:MAG: ATP-binding protein [Chitinispirillales bacterium]|jgi:predicted AAA+ superfamily ATPase|nr:ATP-binding protein [Chitinispirillales bacterium]